MSSIRVVCRFRPLNSKEIDLGTTSIVNISEDASSLSIKGAEANHTFTFDKVYGSETQQEQVYNEVAKPIVEDIFKGYNGTIFVYGQTSSGKTHTMMGPDGGKGMNDPQLKGIIPRMVKTIFESVMNADASIEFMVKVSYIEIYMERIRDLLDSTKTNLQVREEKTKGIWIEDATEIYVTSERDVIDVMKSGSSNRAIAATKMNLESSRSHSIFIVNVFQKNLRDLSNKTGKLYLVDLAGSEKVGKTGAEGQTLNEAKTINKSLSTLGNVINSLTDGKSSHIPYRDSKLTRVLQESLGGNSRTTLIINCSPSSYNEDETLSTLRFGMRAKNIKNKPKINQERSVSELKALLTKAEEEITSCQAKMKIMQEEIEILKSGAGAGGSTLSQADAKEQEELIRELKEELEKIKESKNELQEQLREKDIEIENQNELLEQSKHESITVKDTLDILSKENELLIEKLSLLSIDMEKKEYDVKEMKLTIESLTAQLETNYSKPTESSLSDMVRMKEQEIKNSIQKSFWNAKSSPTVARRVLPSSSSEEEVPSKENSLEAISTSTTPPDIETQVEKTEGESEPTHVAQDGDKIGVESLKEAEVQSESADVQKLNETNKQLREKLEALQQDFNSKKQRDKEEIKRLHKTIERNEQQYGKQLKKLEAETQSKLAEFDLIRDQLLADLQDRCLRVVELQIQLDEMTSEREYIMKHPGALDQKITLQHEKAMEKMNQKQTKLQDENTSLKQQLDVSKKKISNQEDRIKTLESRLETTTEKLKSTAAHFEEEIKKSKQLIETLKTGKEESHLSTGRIAKAIRGGTQSVAPAVPPSPRGEEEKSEPPPVSPDEKTGSFWKRFRSSSGKSSSKESIPASPRQ